SAGAISFTACVSLAVRAVITGVQWQPRLAAVSMSAWMPALPEGSWLDRLITTGVGISNSVIVGSCAAFLGTPMLLTSRSGRATREPRHKQILRRSQRSACAAGLEGPQLYQQDDAQQKEDGKFVEPAIKHVTAAVCPGGELRHQLAAPKVVGNKDGHKRYFGVQPGSAPVVVPRAGHQGEAQQYR